MEVKRKNYKLALVLSCFSSSMWVMLALILIYIIISLINMINLISTEDFNNKLLLWGLCLFYLLFKATLELIPSLMETSFKEIVKYYNKIK